MNEQGGGKETVGFQETYMTIEEVAVYLKLANQTIRKYVLKKSIPYRKVQKSVRFRLSEIEKWIDEGGGDCPNFPNDDQQGDLFGVEETGEPCCPPAADSTGVCCANSSKAGETGADGERKKYD